MAVSCTPGEQSFYQYGGFLALVLFVVSLQIAWQCPYKVVCPLAHFLCLATGVLSLLLGILMLSTGMALAAVMKLSEADLSPAAMTLETKRRGMIARNFPRASRWLLTATGLCCTLALALAKGRCPGKGDKVWADNWCAAPPTSREPDPLLDFGVMAGIWGAMALMGCVVGKASKELPFTYQPTPSELKTAGNACLTAIDKFTKLCHP
mmetsp:Transcript_58804/g.132488  ORF Transcript_58804/g.132488 Transcript_58804/m.132488 type:complete len:208 (-) Transcript_58804:50-673(-)